MPTRRWTGDVLPPTPTGRGRLAARTVDEDVQLGLARDSASWIRKKVGYNEAATATVLALLGSDPDIGVRVAVARHARVPAAVAHALAVPTEAVPVRKSLAYNTHTPADVLAVLATDPDKDVRRGVAQNVNTPADKHRALLSDPEDVVQRAAAWRGHERGSAAQDGSATDRATIDALLTAGAAGAKRLSRMTGLPTDVQVRLVQDADPWTAVNVIEQDGVADEVLDKAVDHPEAIVRQRIAEKVRRELPAGVQLRLAEDADLAVRKALSVRRDLTPAVLEILLAGRSTVVVKNVWQRNSRRNVSPEVTFIDWVLSHGNDRVRAGVATVAPETLETFDALCQDGSAQVRFAAAKRLRGASASRFVADTARDIRLHVANVSDDRAALAVLATDASRDVRLAVAKNRHVVGEALTILSGDSDPEVQTVAVERFMAELARGNTVPQF